MDIFDMLKQDHKKVKNLCEDVLKENDFSKLKELLKQVESEIQIHTDIEEKFLYPEFKTHNETKIMFYEATEEHHLVDQLLKRIKELKQDELAQWKALFKIMSENLNLHIEEEEKQLFEQAKKIIDKEKLEKIKNSAEKEKSKHQKS